MGFCCMGSLSLSPSSRMRGHTKLALRIRVIILWLLIHLNMKRLLVTVKNPFYSDKMCSYCGVLLYGFRVNFTIVAPAIPKSLHAISDRGEISLLVSNWAWNSDLVQTRIFRSEFHTEHRIGCLYITSPGIYSMGCNVTDWKIHIWITRNRIWHYDICDNSWFDWVRDSLVL